MTTAYILYVDDYTRNRPITTVVRPAQCGFRIWYDEDWATLTGSVYQAEEPMSDYAHPEVLVETDWVAENLDNPRIRLVECNHDPLLYHTGHLPGAVRLDWMTDLSDPIRRDLPDAPRFAQMLTARGINNKTTLIFYGDQYNWWATYAFWVCKLFGHADARIMNGGRAKWLAEGRPLTRAGGAERDSEAHQYNAPTRDDSAFRATYRQVPARIGQPDSALVDVRTAQEYGGAAPPTPELPQTLRGGHIPTAVNIPWARLVNPDSSFKRREEFTRIFDEGGITPEKEVISYCLMGGLSSHTWFVLTWLLGYPRVRNYDGGWSEWGNLVAVPVAQKH